MKKIVAALLIHATFLSASLTSAGTNENAKIAGHLVPYAAKNLPSSLSKPPCNYGESHLNVNGSVGVAYHLYLLALDADPSAGLAGATFGIDYSSTGPGNGLRILNWESMADVQLKSKNWPAPGSQISLILHKERPTVSPQGEDDGQLTGVLGRFYVYAYSTDVFEIALNPTPTGMNSKSRDWISAVRVSGSSNESAVVYPDHVGRVGFGATGYDPCKEGIGGYQSKTTTIDLANLSSRLTVSPGHPNPFQNRIQWAFASTKDRAVRVTLFSVSGRLIREWPSVALESGTTILVWNGLDMNGQRASSGVYYLRAQAEDGYRVVRRAVLLQ